jgi:hypothetical protein
MEDKDEDVNKEMINNNILYKRHSFKKRMDKINCESLKKQNRKYCSKWRYSLII